MPQPFSILLSFSVIIALLTGCIPEKEVSYDGVQLDISNPTYQRIYDMQIRQELDSLILNISHPDPTVRYMVAQSFASFQSDKALDSLYKLLGDEEELIRSTTAYTIGQIRNPKSVDMLMRSFVSDDTARVHNELNANILEALGKLADSTVINSIATVKTYTPQDTVLLLGQARSIYQAKLRGIITKRIDNLILESLTNDNIPIKVRSIYAQALDRDKSIDISGYEQRIFKVFQNNKNNNISMFLAHTVSNINDPIVRKSYLNMLNENVDYRLKVNMIRALGNLPYITVIEPIIELLNNKNLHVAKAAGDYIIDHGIASDAIIYKNFIPKDAHYSVVNKVKAAIFKHLPNYYILTKNSIKKEMLKRYEETTDIYEKRSIIKALGYDINNMQELTTLYNPTINPVLKSECVTSMAKILSSDKLDKQRRSFAKKQRQIFVDSLGSIINDGDVGALAVVGTIISNEENGLNELFNDVSLLKDAMGGLKLPKHLETYNELKKAIAFLEGKKYIPEEAHKIEHLNWKLLPISKDSVFALIKTDKGIIKFKLFPTIAPQTVYNFIQLTNSEFYDNKYIHRVVSNFVVQDGCPRGDGFGSLDYVIRSELPQMYYDKEGYIGMASAGLHTECSQWFITHRPTEHLNGRYTIFGKVVDGMEVVYQLMEGDIINDINIIN